MVAEKKRPSSVKAVEQVDEPGKAPSRTAAIMLNHIPEGFFEKAIQNYFEQFGCVKRVRVARSKKTGKCKGYAFVLFDDPDVAQIAAEAMEGYLMFERRITCKTLMSDRVPNCLKYGPVLLGQLPKKHNSADKHARKLNSKRSQLIEHKNGLELVRHLNKRNKDLKKLGIDYEFAPPVPSVLPAAKSDLKAFDVTVKKNDSVEIKDEVPSADEDDDDGDTTFENDASKFSMVVDSSDDEIVFKTPPNTVRKSKRLANPSPAANVSPRTVGNRKQTKSTPTSTAATRKQTPTSASNQRKNGSKIPRMTTGSKVISSDRSSTKKKSVQLEKK